MANHQTVDEKVPASKYALFQRMLDEQGALIIACKTPRDIGQVDAGFYDCGRLIRAPIVICAKATWDDFLRQAKRYGFSAEPRDCYFYKVIAE